MVSVVSALHSTNRSSETALKAAEERQEQQLSGFFQGVCANVHLHAPHSPSCHTAGGRVPPGGQATNLLQGRDTQLRIKH